jgi:hypothetical protein
MAHPTTDFGFWKTEIFFDEGIDANSGSAPDGQISCDPAITCEGHPSHQFSD